MSFLEYYQDYSIGGSEPSVTRLADALKNSTIENTCDKITPAQGAANDDVSLIGHYNSLAISETVHFFSCDMTFDKIFRTRGELPASIWTGAVFSGEMHTRLDDFDILFSATGRPQVVSVGQTSTYMDQPTSSRRLRMSSFLLAESFFDAVDPDDPEDHLAPLKSLIQPGVRLVSIGYNESLMNNLLNLLNNPFRGPTGRLYVETQVMSSVFELAKCLDNAALEPSNHGGEKVNLAYEARHVIDQAPEKFDSIIDLAAKLGTNETTLRRQFKSAFGMTLFEYVLNTRMQAARLLLQDGYLQIAEISHRVGYTTPANFSTAYKRYFGVSPAKDRGKILLG